MKKLDKRTDFERQWEDAFREAELSPSEGLWDKLDSALSKEEAGYFKRKAFMFKLLAAASVAFALGVGVFSLNYYIGQNSEMQVAENTVQFTEQDFDENKNNSLESSNPDNGEINIENNEADFKNSRVDASQENALGSRDAVNRNEHDGDIKNEEISQTDKSLTGRDGDFSTVGNTTFATHTDPGLNTESAYLSFHPISSRGIISEITADVIIVIDHIYRIPMMPRGASKAKKQKETGVYLAGLDFSAGRFDPNFQQGESLLDYAPSGYSAISDARVESVHDRLASFNTSSKDLLLVRSAGRESRPQTSLSYGANVGFRLSNRFVIQTGLAYRKANTSVSTTGYIEEAGSNAKIPIVASHQYQLTNLSSVSRIPETSLQNQYEFAAVPLEAGYILLDKKVNMTLTAGISSEFFLNNKISDDSNLLETLKNSKDEASPYKSVYFNGSLGTMLGYSFAENYQITFEPSYRFAVNSFTKNDFYLNSYPSSFMLTFGVAYNFK